MGSETFSSTFFTGHTKNEKKRKVIIDVKNDTLFHGNKRKMYIHKLATKSIINTLMHSNKIVFTGYDTKLAHTTKVAG